MTILNDINKHKIVEVAERKMRPPLDTLKERIPKIPAAKSFSAALRRGANIRIIAEIKKASPSLGVIRKDFHPVEIARIYEAGGAAAISVLTDENFFQGSLSYLTEVKKAVGLPTLRKDFIIDPYQIYEARAARAAAILLIAAGLPKKTLSGFITLKESLS